MPLNNKLLVKILCSIILLFSVYLSYSNYLGALVENYTEQGIKRTLITYAVARSINGVISVAQGTELDVSPAGVGLTFAPGQILDPVNDVIERFSWVVMVSATSLGIQRMLLEVTSSALVSSFLFLLVIIYVLNTWNVFKKLNIKFSYTALLNKSLLLMLCIRFSIPVLTLLNEGLYVIYLQPQFETAQTHLQSVSNNIEAINTSSSKATDKTDESLMARIDLWLNNTKKSLSIEDKINSLKQASADISQQVINLIVVFIVQTILFPLFFLWAIMKTMKLTMKKITG
ncbi:hypothetical protein MNBD_GAMMA08-2378 [hydrothermal vent metagenome]|uniref:Uncharacterized protein n=1 Tax=hydrothermal vent metagenome TaxID=652676 RepID=A0A3B0XEK5_9ZZZZ